MNTGLLRSAALLTGASLLVAGCSSGPSDGRPGPFAGANGAAAASQITRAAGSYTGEAMATGANVNVAAQATVAILAKHQATQRQKEVARQHAQAAVRRIQRKAVAANQKASAARKPGEKPVAVVLKPYKVPRYIAVETVKDEQTAPKAQKVIMLWDTQAQDLVGNSVYDIANPPPVGATSRFETYSAEYVGAGL